MQLGTILVPYDFSSHSEAALKRAVDLAKASKAKLHLLHAYAWPEFRDRFEAHFGPPDGLED